MKAKQARQLKEHRAAYATRPSRRSRTPRELPFPQARYLTRKERIALKAFRDFMLEKYPDQVERMVLYGSKARGDSTSESDVDVLVVVSDARSSKAWDSLSPNWSAVTAYESELSLKYGVGISSKFAYRDEARKWTPLLAHIQVDGAELWRKRGAVSEPWPEGGEIAMALSKQEHIEARVAIAKEKLLAAQKMFESNLYNDTILCAYYAMFYASKALLLSLGEDPHKHEGVVSLFGERIAKIGLSDPKYGSLLRNAKNLRIRADYEDFFHATREQAEDAIRDAEDFMNEAQEILKRIQTRGE